MHNLRKLGALRLSIRQNSNKPNAMKKTTLWVKGKPLTQALATEEDLAAVGVMQPGLTQHLRRSSATENSLSLDCFLPCLPQPAPVRVSKLEQS